MIEIDGQTLEGGGQLLRTSLALSALTGKAVRIFNIRKGREKPGLFHQHLMAVKAVQSLCNAKVRGAKLRSEEIEFKPGPIKGGNYKFDIGTAGSTTLLLQAFLPPACFADDKVEVEIIGGTDNPWAPPIDYFMNVMVPIFSKIGLDCKVSLIKRGFYPKGGGRIRAIINPVSMNQLNPIHLTKQGRVIEIKGISYASNHLKKAKVAERQASSAKNQIKTVLNLKPEIEIQYCDSLSPGSGVVIWAKTDTGAILGADSLGKRGKSAEDVGKECGKRLIMEIKSGAPVDVYLADDLVLWIGLVGGEIKTSKISLHTKTNLWVCSQFLNKEFDLKDNLIKLST